MRKNNFLETYIKYIVTILIFIIIFFSIYIAIIFIYTKNQEYRNSYFEKNQSRVSSICEYLIENNYSWHIYTDTSIYKNIVNNKKSQKNCFIENCNLDKNILWEIKKLNINFLFIQDKSITLKFKWKILWNEDNYIYYSSWFYKWKEELESINWNNIEKIIKIFNNDWWIINSCYECTWAWD